jgi:hypothetical protein
MEGALRTSARRAPRPTARPQDVDHECAMRRRGARGGPCCGRVSGPSPRGREVRAIFPASRLPPVAGRQSAVRPSVAAAAAAAAALHRLNPRRSPFRPVQTLATCLPACLLCLLCVVSLFVSHRQNSPSVVLMSTFASMRETHFLMSEHSLSRVRSMPWKLVRTLKPCTSSQHSLIFLNVWSSSLFRSARLTSKTRPLSPSEAIFVPWVRVMRVLPHVRAANMFGAFTAYHSFLRKGSTAFFLPPFFDFVNRLFLPAEAKIKRKRMCVSYTRGRTSVLCFGRNGGARVGRVGRVGKACSSPASSQQPVRQWRENVCQGHAARKVALAFTHR